MADLGCAYSTLPRVLAFLQSGGEQKLGGEQGSLYQESHDRTQIKHQRYRTSLPLGENRNGNHGRSAQLIRAPWCDW